MQKTVKNLFSKITDDSWDFRIRLFTILALGGITISTLTLILSVFTAMWYSALISGFLILLSGGLILFTQKTGKYQTAYIITVTVIFMVCFPVMFFTSGGHKSGMPAVFIFAVLFTVLMIKGRKAIVIFLFEIAEYSAVCIFAYFHPEYVTFYETEAQILTDIVFAFSCVSVVCGFTLYIHLKEYDRQRKILEEQNEKLKRYDASRSVFLTTVSHEIKNPLNSVNLHARDTLELTEESPIDLELVRENQHVIEKMVGRIDTILMDLKDTVAIEQGRLSLKLAPMTTQKLIREAAENYFNKNFNADNELVLDLDESLSPINADYARVTQVITNLLSNAMRHTKHGRITVSLSSDGENQCISVKDNGEGMSEEIRKKAMDGYVSTSEEYWRHGIGLYVCHQIVTAHGGTIHIESEKGKGTLVCFTLPYIANPKEIN